MGQDQIFPRRKSAKQKPTEQTPNEPAHHKEHSHHYLAFATPAPTYAEFNETMHDLMTEKLALLKKAKEIEQNGKRDYATLIRFRKLCKEIVLVEEELEEVERNFRNGRR